MTTATTLGSNSPIVCTRHAVERLVQRYIIAAEEAEAMAADHAARLGRGEGERVMCGDKHDEVRRLIVGGRQFFPVIKHGRVLVTYLSPGQAARGMATYGLRNSRPPRRGYYAGGSWRWDKSG